MGTIERLERLVKTLKKEQTYSNEVYSGSLVKNDKGDAAIVSVFWNCVARWYEWYLVSLDLGVAEHIVNTTCNDTIDLSIHGFGDWEVIEL